MPTATDFTWAFPWEQMVGGFNAFMTMLTVPIALAIALILAFTVGAYIVGMVKRARG